jgi:hypothetical protein
MGEIFQNIHAFTGSISSIGSARPRGVSKQKNGHCEE